MRRPCLIAEAMQLHRLPRVGITMSGDERCRVLYDAYTRRHARWRVIQNKAWGVALLRIPERFEDYYQDPNRSHMRKQVRRAKRAGYTFDRIDPFEHLDEIMDINRSVQERQGRPMHPDYLDEAKVHQYFEGSGEVFGVLDAASRLQAYRGLRICGAVACGERVLGHAAHLRHGIMYLLFAEIVQVLTRRREVAGGPDWLLYDMFLGASPGMRQFKEWIGFEPHRVSWSWDENAPSSLDRPTADRPTQDPAE